MSRASAARKPAARADSIAAVAILAVGIAVAGLVPVSAAGRGGDVGAERYLSAYDAAPTSRDRLPKWFPVELHGDGGLLPATSRYLGEVEGAAYWSVVDRAGGLCLVVDDTRRGMTAAGCGKVAELERGAIALSHTGVDEDGLQAFLIADGVGETRLSDPWVRAGDNLIVAPVGESVEALTLTRSGRDYVLTPFPLER